MNNADAQRYLSLVPAVGPILGFLIAGGLIFFLGEDLARHNREYESKKDAHDTIWRDATIARICRDGTRVFHLTDGTYRVNAIGGDIKVAGPEVCS